MNVSINVDYLVAVYVVRNVVFSVLVGFEAFAGLVFVVSLFKWALFGIDRLL